MNNRFAELGTELIEESKDAPHGSFWNQEQSVHWGFFDQSTGSDFYKACQNLNCIMAQKSGIDAQSKVLDLGCGDGSTSIWLARAFGCYATGVDINGVRIGNAEESVRTQQDYVQSRLRFEIASPMNLPFRPNTFSHVWSQAFYQMQDNRKALKEAYRVLQPGGILVFHDLLRSGRDINEPIPGNSFDTLVFDTGFSFESYKEALEHTGFQILCSEDISHHLRKSYTCLSKTFNKRKDTLTKGMAFLTLAYGEICEAMDRHDVGWGLFVCRKSN